jgi:hypothetical protein
MGNKERKIFYAGAWRSEKEIASQLGVGITTFRKQFFNWDWNFDKIEAYGTRKNRNKTQTRTTTAWKPYHL